VRKTTPPSNWKVTTESVYLYGREERLREAYEKVVPEKSISLKPEENGDEKFENRSVCKGIKQKTSSGEDD
jgi:hypothetical protein